MFGGGGGDLNNDSWGFEVDYYPTETKESHFKSIVIFFQEPINN